ncbi:AMP-binding protein [Actinomadura atramentaria]|uniref:AMP-binding protein n=1 Tax=Actinomadura atramentaria TaxID=1990 RepID=UPI00036EEFD9|nr:AMP-binding protein [Actinomadura atramentaria]
MTVAAQLAARAADDRTGLVCAASGDAWTWADTVAECAARAAWLAALPGPGRPVHVGVLLDNDPEMVFLIGGAALAGAVVVALNPTRGPAELAADAARADCDLLVAAPAHLGAARTVAARLGVPVTALADHAAAMARHRDAAPPDARAVTPETLLMLVFTSGTSGRPRAVRVTHRKVTVPGASLAGRLLTDSDAVYCPMPLFHSGALMAAFAPALTAGAALVLRPRFSASRLLPDVRAHGCTYLHYVGKALSYVLATPERPDDADNPLRVAFGNEAAPAEQRAFAARFGCGVVDAYGSTETAISLSPDPAGPPGALGRLGDGVAILDPGTGRRCPPARLDEAGRPRNPEAVGELVGAGTGLFDGYYKEDAPDRVRDGRFWSGDLAYADAAGWVYFAGRAADRIRVDGENFGAVQVERALAGLPGVRRLAVYGVPDAASGDEVMAALALDGGPAAFDPAAFAAFLRTAPLGAKWLPRYVRLTGDLPVTASNKVLRRALAAEGWRVPDPVWWRPGRAPDYRPLTPDDAADLRARFAGSGRLHLLEGKR